MTNNNKISDEKFWYDINRETAKILALLSGKIDKYKCIRVEKILPSGSISSTLKYIYTTIFK